jgi:transcriptional regulator with XRE-family HTH domain
MISSLMHRGAASPTQLQRRLATNIRLLRQRSGLSQDALSSRAGVAVRHLQKLEAGEVNVTLKTLSAVSAALDVDPHVLLQEPRPQREVKS